MTTTLPINAKVVVGYFPGWAIHARGYHVSDIPADKLTHVNYAFAGVSTSGECISINLQDDQINFPALQLMKQQRSNIRTLISIGGASNSSNFPKAAKDSARQSFAQSCVNFMKSSRFDGIDVDWEFPTAADKSNYTALLKELRSQLDAQGTADGRRYLLTAALPAGPNEYAHFELSEIHQYLDWVNLLAYDFYTASSPRTDFSAPLYASSTNPEPDEIKRTSYNVDAAVKAYLAAGVPAAKIVVGVPFFGNGWIGIPNTNNGLYQSTSGPAQGTWQNDGIFDFKDLTSNYVGTYLRFWNAEASAPWLYNPNTGLMISYDDAQSLALKASYVVSNNLAGVMIWHLSADDAKFSLLNALVNKLSPSPEPVTSQSTEPILNSSTRSIPKATLASLKVDVPSEGQAITKLGYVRQLALQPGEVSTVRQSLAAFAASLKSDDFSSTSPLWDLLTPFEGAPMPSLLPSASEFTRIPAATLQSFGNALMGLRKQALEHASLRPSALDAADPIQSPVRLAARRSDTPWAANLGRVQQLLHIVATANKAFEINTSVSPIGMLNLERLEMTPAGIERGELIATIPLAPGERTAVVQKEWSVTTREFTSIVTDSLENYSETGVTDNTELAQSTASQIQHANQFNITGTVSGGIPLISGSVTSSFGLQDSSSQSATDSRKHAVAVTQKASSRTKQEHKVTISTTTVTGTSETTTRELVNSSLTDPIRIDYFSMMRKWRVRLYRYGLRLTYDLVIPEPAGALRKAYADIAWLRSQMGPFTFPWKHSDITQKLVDTEGRPTVDGSGQPKYQWLEEMYGAQVPPPPGPPYHLDAIGGEVHDLRDNGAWCIRQLPVGVPDGYQIRNVFLHSLIGSVEQASRSFFLFGVGAVWQSYLGTTPIGGQIPVEDLAGTRGFLVGATGHQTITYSLRFVDTAVILFDIIVEPTPEKMANWVSDAWNTLYNAAQTQYYARMQDLAARISQLEDQLSNVDTLTLRREESDEIMKGVLRFLLGPDFDFMPPEVISAIKNSGATIGYGVGFTGNELGLSKDDLTIVRQYEDKVRFINQAIEWENVVSFLYSYFWDVPNSWEFIRQIRHPDANRQAFLRAGAARVVLTVRKGWEEAWVRFAEGGFKDAAIPKNHPYLTIAQEIAAYDDRNYPGIPPANPGHSAVRLQDAVYTSSRATLSPSPKPVEIEVDSSAGFLVGAQVVIDSKVSTDSADHFGRQEAQIITDIRDGKHITVQKLEYAHGDQTNLFSIIQPGEKGVLIAEWNEYTPTSGTDIAVTSNLASIS